MKNVLYLHGFASSPAGRKVSALRELLTGTGLRVAAPDLNAPSFRRLNFDAMVRIALWEARRLRPAVVIGSSLGALVALEASRRGAVAPLLLVAPALGFAARWTEKLPPGDPVTFLHHGEGRELPIHRAFFERMAACEADATPPAQPVVVLIGERDESVPPDVVRETWTGWEDSGALPSGSRYIEVHAGDHGLVDSVPLIAQEVLALSGTAAAPA